MNIFKWFFNKFKTNNKENHYDFQIKLLIRFIKENNAYHAIKYKKNLLKNLKYYYCSTPQMQPFLIENILQDVIDRDKLDANDTLSRLKYLILEYNWWLLCYLDKNVKITNELRNHIINRHDFLTTPERVRLHSCYNINIFKNYLHLIALNKKHYNIFKKFHEI